MSSKTPPLAAKPRRGRPPKKADNRRVHKVTVALTEREYEYFRQMAGHEPLPKLASPTARPRRRHGSMAGLIRLLIKQSRLNEGRTSLVTVEQERLLGQLANQTNLLGQLAQKAESAGFLTVVLPITALQERLNSLIDGYDRQSRQPSTTIPELPL